ncbi:hypothetical protein I8748_05510 [Nostoc sp. CENA67]|uniref:Uncharacterized protein n=1 Tax=Amazonocrinis nigriterrae CENA67 TaxID=2794033 RepID=A0A8J7L714_9NOST|nr:hypothetical protein [Amazonocrinis nigriterrae]MBH8561640.1 hypothetical protein [Amazonocrinis nigriterrae CENA67]
MTLQLDLTAVGAWELTYYQKLVGNPQNRRIRAPLIDPVELPYLTEQHIFVVAASWINAKPTWIRAGYFYQQIDGIKIDDTVVFEGLGQIPSTQVDSTRRLIKLNAIELVIFPQLTNSYRLRFEALPWIQEVTLGVWEYRGTQSDTTEDLINAVRSKLETIEFKINNL